MELGKVYFLMEMTDEDFMALMLVCRNLGVKKEQLIMDAIKNYILKLQEEWRKTQQLKNHEEKSVRGETK